MVILVKKQHIINPINFIILEKRFLLTLRKNGSANAYKTNSNPLKNIIRAYSFIFSFLLTLNIYIVNFIEKDIITAYKNEEITFIFIISLKVYSPKLFHPFIKLLKYLILITPCNSAIRILSNIYIIYNFCTYFYFSTNNNINI